MTQQSTTEGDYRVFSGDQEWPNIFECLGFSPEEAKQMIAKVEAEVAESRRQALRQARVFLAAGGKTKQNRWARFPAGRARA